MHGFAVRYKDDQWVQAETAVEDSTTDLEGMEEPEDLKENTLRKKASKIW